MNWFIPVCLIEVEYELAVAYNLGVRAERRAVGKVWWRGTIKRKEKKRKEKKRKRKRKRKKKKREKKRNLPVVVVDASDEVK